VHPRRKAMAKILGLPLGRAPQAAGHACSYTLSALLLLVL